MDLYAPLADRLGIYWIRTELEDISFKILKPHEFAEIEYAFSNKKVIGKFIHQKFKDYSMNSSINIILRLQSRVDLKTFMEYIKKCFQKI